MESTTNERDEIKRLMIEDYERVIFFLIKRLGNIDVDEINVVMNAGSEVYDFKIKKPYNLNELPVVRKIEYLTEISYDHDRI